MKSSAEAPEKYDYEDCRMVRGVKETGIHLPKSLQERMDAARAAPNAGGKLKESS